MRIAEEVLNEILMQHPSVKHWNNLKKIVKQSNKLHSSYKGKTPKFNQNIIYVMPSW
jgi:hypothetical protein